MRASQVSEFATELTKFCDEIVEIVNFDESIEGTLQKMNDISTKQTSVEGSLAFKKSVVLIGTPGNFTSLISRKEFSLHYHSIVLDKVDLL